MEFRFTSESELRSVAHHLRVAQARYLGHASEVCNRRVSEQFTAQAQECERIAEAITEQIG